MPRERFWMIPFYVSNTVLSIIFFNLPSPPEVQGVILASLSLNTLRSVAKKINIWENSGTLLVHSRILTRHSTSFPNILGHINTVHLGLMTSVDAAVIQMPLIITLTCLWMTSDFYKVLQGSFDLLTAEQYVWLSYFKLELMNYK